MIAEFESSPSRVSKAFTLNLKRSVMTWLVVRGWLEAMNEAKR